MENIRIELARIEHLERIQEIEASAAMAFLPFAKQLSFPANEVQSQPEWLYQEAIRQQLCWVASLNDKVTGFLCAQNAAEDTLHIQELDVDFSAQKQGVGTALLTLLITFAQRNAMKRITLTTFRDVPFNAPFYSKHGFIPMENHQLTPFLIKTLKHEKGIGLSLSQRCAMQLLL